MEGQSLDDTLRTILLVVFALNAATVAVVFSYRLWREGRERRGPRGRSRRR